MLDGCLPCIPWWGSNRLFFFLPLEICLVILAWDLPYCSSRFCQLLLAGGWFYWSTMWFFLWVPPVLLPVSGKLPRSDCLRTPLNGIFKSSTGLQYVSFMVYSLNFLMTQLRMLKYDKPRWSSLPLHVVIFQATQLWLIVWQSQHIQSSCIRANFPKISSSDTAKRMLISFLWLCPESHSKSNLLYSSDCIS